MEFEFEDVLLKKLTVENERWLQKLVDHSKKVKDISMMICEKIDIEENEKKIIVAAALLHDIKKHVGDNHNKVGAKYIEKNLKDFYPCNEKEKKIIKCIVKHHKGSKYLRKNCSDERIRMIEIVRISDKISKIYKGKVNEEEIIKKIKKLHDKKVKSAATEVLNELTSKVVIKKKENKKNKLTDNILKYNIEFFKNLNFG